jgi:hypothetical protein
VARRDGDYFPPIVAKTPRFRHPRRNWSDTLAPGRRSAALLKQLKSNADSIWDPKRWFGRCFGAEVEAMCLPAFRGQTTIPIVQQMDIHGGAPSQSAAWGDEPRVSVPTIGWFLRRSALWMCIVAVAVVLACALYAAAADTAPSQTPAVAKISSPSPAQTLPRLS